MTQTQQQDQHPWADQPFPLIPTSKVTKPQASPDAIWLADSMALVHNMFTRALNSIYLQAPYVHEPADIQDLLQYCLFWEGWIHHHHEAEETQFFPAIERITGTAGLMSRNVEQHHAFTPGLAAWKAYVEACREGGTQTFDSKRFISLIDVFAPTLVQHLAEEIPTLLELPEEHAKAVVGEWKVWEKKIMAEADKSIEIPMALGTLDWEYEGGCTFPELPFFVPHLVNIWFGRKHRSVWRFGPNSLLGKRRPLVFLPKN